MTRKDYSLSYTQKEQIALIEWLIDKLDDYGHSDVEYVKTRLGLNSNKSKIALLKNFENTKSIYENFICNSFSNSNSFGEYLINYNDDDYN